MRNIRFMPALAAVAAALALGVAACGGDNGASSSAGGGGSSEELNGTIRIDGSSTVFPFAEAAGELFNEEQPGVQVTVGQSGTGGGFEKFCNGETDLSDASREIKDEEATACKGKNIDYTSFRVDASVSDVHARRLSAGQPVTIRVGSDTLDGTIASVEPTVVNGTITVVIALAQPSNPLLRSNLRVDVEIVTARRPATLRVRRGPFASGEGTQPVFVVRGDRAVREMATFGLSSVEFFEVTAGLAPGDEVIVSDMRDYQRLSQIRLK